MRILFATTQGAGHYNPLVPFIEAARRAGHEVMVAAPPTLEDTVRRDGYPFHMGASPPDEEMGPIWSRVPQASYEEAEQLVIGEIFATLNVRAMLPSLRAAVEKWRPDLIAREPAEFASGVVAEEMGVPHVHIGTGLVSTFNEMLAIARDHTDRWRPGLTDRLLASPYLTLYPASIDASDAAEPAALHRFRDPAADAPDAPLDDRWDGDTRPLVYVTFGSVAANMPPAAPIYGVALEAVADLPARVLLTTGNGADLSQLPSPGPHVHVTKWVPQADVLPHARVVVCHGGAGTTLGSLAAGVPLVVTPLFADQPQNGHAVATAGAGLVVEPRDAGAIRSGIDPADLRAAIDTVLSDDGYARRARAIAQEIRALPPADAALETMQAVA